MQIIYNRFLPFPGFRAINLFGVLFIRTDAPPLTVVGFARMLRHEKIHTRQMRELLYVGFYLWYFLEWLLRLLIYRNARRAYRSISFEQEAYAHQGEPSYLCHRRRFAFLATFKLADARKTF